mmetsp:Transcript_32650/g.45527  ORF Transcript_32650/g.45527 Transcript_32650/m.45527 type:complete len:352 (+) Transcript_32650:60-1115(+)
MAESAIQWVSDKFDWLYEKWYCNCCDKLNVTGCCCPSEKNSDEWNYWTSNWVLWLYNKIPVPEEEKKVDKSQFFKKQRFEYRTREKPENHTWCICCCWCRYICQFRCVMKRSCGHTIYSCVSEPLTKCGICSVCLPCFRVQPIRKVLLAGLKGSGKTFLFRKLLTGAGSEIIAPDTGPSTRGFVDTVVTFNLWQKYEVFDIGGDDTQRQFWRTYYSLMVKFDTIVYCIDATKYLRTNFGDEVVNKERQEIHKILASPELRPAQIICYLVFRDAASNLNWKEKERKGREILSTLEVRISENQDQSRTKFPQQRVFFVADYKELLHKLKIDSNIHGNGLLENNDEDDDEEDYV